MVSLILAKVLILILNKTMIADTTIKISGRNTEDLVVFFFVVVNIVSSLIFESLHSINMILICFCSVLTSLMSVQDLSDRVWAMHVVWHMSANTGIKHRKLKEQHCPRRPLNRPRKIWSHVRNNVFLVVLQMFSICYSLRYRFITA